MGEQADLEIDNAILNDDSWLEEDENFDFGECPICGDDLSECGHYHVLNEE
jgi:hypothetical protein